MIEPGWMATPFSVMNVMLTGPMMQVVPPVSNQSQRSQVEE